MNKNNKKKAGDNFEKPIINTKCTKLTKKNKNKSICRRNKR